MDSNVLVLSAGGPAGVNFIKAVGWNALGCGTRFHIYGADSNPYHLPLFEKECIRAFKIPHVNSPDYIDKINEIIVKYDIDIVHAQSDIEVRKISDNREKLNATVFLPSKTTIEICQDKYQTALIWSTFWKDANGILIDDWRDVNGILIDDNTDLVNKVATASHTWGPFWMRACKGAGGKASTLCTTQKTAIAWAEYWWEINIAWQSVWSAGKLITSQARERIEYIYPHLTPSGITGTPSVQRTINEYKINKTAEIAVLMIDPYPCGVYSVDLKENDEGEPIPTEINAGRFFTTSNFFAYASRLFIRPRANMPYVYLELAHGDELHYPPPCRNLLPEDIYWIRL